MLKSIIALDQQVISFFHISVQLTSLSVMENLEILGKFRAVILRFLVNSIFLVNKSFIFIWTFFVY